MPMNSLKEIFAQRLWNKYGPKKVISHITVSSIRACYRDDAINVIEERNAEAGAEDQVISLPAHYSKMGTAATLVSRRFISPT